MERSKAIAGISPNAKEAIKKAKLHDDQRALLRSPKSTPYDQVKEVRELRTTRNTRRAALEKTAYRNGPS